MNTGLARVTISAPERRVDVALPEHVALAELLPEVLRHAGVGLADDGERHGGWLLRRTDGVALAPGQGLFPQGVRDGEVLHLVPARAQWPELEYDDVVEAIADGARRRGAAWSPASTRVATLTAAGVLLAAGLVALLHQGPAWWGTAVVGLGVAVLLTLAAVVGSRAYGDAPAGAALGGYALPYAFVGGAALVAPGDPAGVLAPLAWLGGPELLTGCTALLLVAVLGAVGVASSVRVFAAGVVVGLLGAVAALVSVFVPAGAAGAAAILLAALVCGIGVLPLLAIRIGKLPMPPIALPTGTDTADGGSPTGAGPSEGAWQRPDPERVFTSVARTEELLTGMLTGHAVLSVAATVVLVAAGGTAGRVLVGVCAAALLLRSRLFVTVRQRVPLVGAGLAGLTVLAVALLWGATGADLLILTIGVVVAALVTVVAGATYSQRPPSPYLGRAADILDTVMVVSVVPVACAVLGLYARARGLGA
ncbi:MAG TPA: type VII secretion integral membrane protein EccD [Catenuloplanes sp.]|jgi:type VII secretion integral membrane protein EccD